jgi:hypothetical protein
VRIVGLLSWYEENPAWLGEMIASLPAAGISHLIALDGAYALFPGASPTSDLSNVHAIQAACDAAGITYSIHQPVEVWEGNEVEKRSALFELAEQGTTEEDWYFVMDADETITSVPADFVDRLATSSLDVGMVTFYEPPREATGPAPNFRWQRKRRYPIRVLFRAIRGLRVHKNHWTYVTPDGRRLWGQNKRSLEPALDCTDLEIFHRSDLRHEARRADQYAYYATRDEQKAELADCTRCGTKATRSVPTAWQPSPEGLTADYIDVCDSCAEDVKAENAPVLREHGIDPETMRPLLLPSL